MGWITLTALAGVVLIALLIVGSTMRRSTDAEARSIGSLVGKWVPLVLIVVWGIMTGLMSVHPIQAGHVAVVYQFGAIVGQVPEGFQMVAPWQDVRVASIQVLKKTFSDKERLDAFSEETQDVFVVASLNYSVAPAAIQGLYRDVGSEWFNVLVYPRVLNFFKDETVKYKTVDIAPNREHIRVQVRDRLKQALAPYSITVHDLLIDNIDFRDAFKNSIEQKQIATQDALREQERVQQKKYEAEQAVATAKGQANSTYEIAQGEAKAIRELADGQTYANKVIGQSLTDDVIRFQALQKLAPNVQIALLPSGQGLIIDPATLLKKEEDK